MKNALSEMEETGDGRDCDVDGELAETLDEAVQESRAEKRQYLDNNETVTFVDRNIVMLSETESQDYYDKKTNTYVPTPPEDWIPDAPKYDLGEPPFGSVDNPGDSSQYTFRPKFEGGAKKKRWWSIQRTFLTDWCYSCSYSIKWKKNDFRLGFSL